MNMTVLMGISVSDAYKVKFSDQPYKRILAKSWASYIENKIMEVVDKLSK